jgi:hypothetical protein
MLEVQSTAGPHVRCLLELPPCEKCAMQSFLSLVMCTHQLHYTRELVFDAVDLCLCYYVPRPVETTCMLLYTPLILQTDAEKHIRNAHAQLFFAEVFLIVCPVLLL